MKKHLSPMQGSLAQSIKQSSQFLVRVDNASIMYPASAIDSLLMINSKNSNNIYTSSKLLQKKMRGIDTWNGSLSAADFYASANYFSQKWKEINSDFPNWVWIPCSRLGSLSEVSNPTIIDWDLYIYFFFFQKRKLSNFVPQTEGYLALEKLNFQIERRKDSSLVCAFLPNSSLICIEISLLFFF